MSMYDKITVITFPNGSAPTHVVVNLCHQYGYKVTADQTRPDVVMIEYDFTQSPELKATLHSTDAEVRACALNDPTLPFQPHFHR